MNFLLIGQTKTINLRFNDVFYIEEFCKLVRQFFFKFRILEIFRKEHHLIFYFKVSEINFVVVRFDLRSLCASKTFYKMITLISQKLNSIFNNEHIRAFSLVSIELKFRLIIEHCLEREKSDKRMNDVIVYILCQRK